MAGDWEFDVLDYPKESLRTDNKDYFRVYVALGVLKALGLEKGDSCSLIQSGNSVGIVLVWEHNKGSRTRDIQISKRLQSLYGVGHGTKVCLSKQRDQLPSAFNVILHEVALDESKASFPKLRDQEAIHWAWLLEYFLYRAENVGPGMIIEGIEAKGQRRSFRILRVNGSSRNAPHRFQQPCSVDVIGDEVSINDGALMIPSDGIGGLEAEVTKLNKTIASFGSPQGKLPISSALPDWKNGIVLYGASGTGKTLLLRMIAKAGWRGIFDLGAEISKHPFAPSKALVAMKDIFADAKKCEPSVILLDKLETFAAYDTSHSSVQDTTFIDALCQEVERLGSFRSLLVATARSMAKISPELRNVHAIFHEIEIPVPNSRSRASILKVLSGLPTDATNAVLESIASRTHGFVGADLAMLLYIAIEEGRYRINTIDKTKNTLFSMGQIQEQDFGVAFQEVKPTAIREVFVEIQETRWDDIGGQGEVKEILNQALIWPSKYPEYFKAQAIRPGTGLLLYGPPGCSKTMIARAAATESNYRCIAVKGAELLNMYVGESERLIRDIFSRARAVKPSILFFDEIDAIGTSRSDSQHSGLNIVTTLLNEMDGIDTFSDVFVLAATNRPDVIDGALTRPGRLDKMLYVGPPDLDARRSILSRQIQKMTVEEDLDVGLLAQETGGFSGAELIKICNDAGLAAIKEFISKNGTDGSQKLPVVGRRHVDKVLNGAEKAIDLKMLQVFEDFQMKHRDQHVKG